MNHSISVVLVSAIVSAATGYVSYRLSQRLEDRQRAYHWRIAIISEIRTLRTRLAQYEQVYESRVVTGEISGSRVLRVLLQPGDISVFASSSSSVGLFDTRTAIRVLRFYADVRSLQGHALVMAENAGRAGAAPSEADIMQHRKMLRRCQRLASDMVRRQRLKGRKLGFMRRVWRRL